MDNLKKSSIVGSLCTDKKVCCPNDSKAHWQAHPRVYLKFGDQSQATCPYCGTVYQMTR